MDLLTLHEFHQGLGGRFIDVNGREAVTDYGDALAEYTALAQKAVVFDLSFRSRLCLTGADRLRFLHGQVTNEIKNVPVGMGCYAALVTSKGRMQSDLNVYCLADELLLDFEPGLAGSVTQRLEKYIVADDVQVVDVEPHYGLLSVQGPQSAAVVGKLQLFADLPDRTFRIGKSTDASGGEIYLAKLPRLATDGFDLFVPAAMLRAVAEKLTIAARSLGGSPGGWEALEIARIEAGIPRYGVDMDETNLPQECGIESRAISYTKGCYIGQEVLNRLHTLGHVNRELRGFLLSDELKLLPLRGDKFIQGSRELGSVTSALKSPRLNSNIALGYLRRDVNPEGEDLMLRTAEGESRARVVNLPFVLT